MNNKKCKIRPEVINISSNEPSFYPYSVKISKCSGSWNNINDPYTHKFICRLDAIVCNNKHRWNEGKCRCEWKELIDKEICDKGLIWNPSNCECECDKSCDVIE